MKIKGKYAEAIIYNDEVEQEAISQIFNLLNQEFSKDSHVRIMPDVHAGAGCVIGYTAKLKDKIVPNLIGVDGSCGLLGYNLGKNLDYQFDRLDEFIKKNIPSGRNILPFFDKDEISKLYNFLNIKEYVKWKDYEVALRDLVNKTDQNIDYVLASIGTMGGGNHYIELGKSELDENNWIIVHSGSRNFGLKVAKYHQRIAEKKINSRNLKKEIEKIKQTKKGKEIEEAIKKLYVSKSNIPHGLEYLEGEDTKEYFHDMRIVQIYARLNRLTMIYKIVGFYNKKFELKNLLETLHNYIDFDNKIIRKGAVSAKKDELLFIPMNMSYGTLLCKGKGNEEYNFSAPHGAGRAMSRSKARKNVSLNDFEKTMTDAKVWSSCVDESTLDESPQAYKDPNDIMKYLEPTVEIIYRIKSLYNFKDSSKS